MMFSASDMMRFEAVARLLGEVLGSSHSSYAAEKAAMNITTCSV